MQLFVAMNASDAVPTLNRLTDCSSAVRVWFLRNGLQLIELNADKSEVIILSSLSSSVLPKNITTVDVAGSKLTVSDYLKSLGVTFGSHLRLELEERSTEMLSCVVFVALCSCTIS